MQLEVFNRTAGSQLPMATRTAKSGHTTTGYISKKAYGAQFNIKGAALSRAHLQYRIDMGVTGNVNIAAMLTGGEILAQKITTTKDGFKVAFARAGVLGAAPQRKPEEVAGQLTDEQLLAIIAARKPQPAAQPTA